MAALKIITTADGSHSLFNEELNETYHSVHGAIQESEHVFIQNGLKHCLQTGKQDQISILEVGFGTGLNALLTIAFIQSLNTMVKYTTIEAFPLEKNIWSTLNYTDTEIQKKTFAALHENEWGKDHVIVPCFEFHKIHNTLQEVALPVAFFDLVYFDAFAPGKQPELWTFIMLQKVVDAMKAGGVFVTYCAKGQLKRDLRALGCAVESLPGPPGKMEMVRATKALL